MPFGHLGGLNFANLGTCGHSYIKIYYLSFRTTASKFSKVVIFIRSFLQILYHSIITKVVAINIQALEE